MHIQQAPKSTDKKTVVIASRNNGGFWSSVVVNVIENEMHDNFGILRRWREVDWDNFDAAIIDAQLCDEHYISFAGEDVSEKQARAGLFESVR